LLPRLPVITARDAPRVKRVRTPSMKENDSVRDLHWLLTLHSFVYVDAKKGQLLSETKNNQPPALGNDGFVCDAC
jgi:hypothetical protein